MKRLTCLFIVGALMLVLSGVALAALPSETLDINLTVHPHAELNFAQTAIDLQLYDDEPESDRGFAYFTVFHNIPIDVEVEARPFYRRPDLRNLALEYELDVQRWIGLPGTPIGVWSTQCSTGSSIFDPNGKFSKDWDLVSIALYEYRVRAQAERTDAWYLIKAGDYDAEVVFTVSAQS